MKRKYTRKEKKNFKQHTHTLFNVSASLCFHPDLAREGIFCQQLKSQSVRRVYKLQQRRWSIEERMCEEPSGFLWLLLVPQIVIATWKAPLFVALSLVMVTVINQSTETPTTQRVSGNSISKGRKPRWNRTFNAPVCLRGTVTIWTPARGRIWQSAVEHWELKCAVQCNLGNGESESLAPLRNDLLL